MDHPLITIITVTYNAIESIEDTILSVINQDYQPIEYIIIDGGSTDGTLEIINKYKEKISLWISEPDKGIYDAMNKGVRLASGEWINFMNAGDKFKSDNTLQCLFSTDISDSKLVIYGDTCLIFDNRSFYMPAASIDQMSEKLPFCHQASFIRSSYMKENIFSLKYKVSSDYDSFYKIYMNNKEAFLYLPVIVAVYNFDSGFSVKNNLICIKEHKTINKSDSFSSDINYMITYTKEYIKRILPKKISNLQKARALEKLYTKLPETE